MPGKMWISRLKDRALAEATRLFLNRHFQTLGKITALHLDTENHQLEVTADLAGESQPIQARVAYRLEAAEGQLHFVPAKVECSRPWIELLAAQMLADGALKLPVPAGLATTVVKMLKV